MRLSAKVQKGKKWEGTSKRRTTQNKEKKNTTTTPAAKRTQLLVAQVSLAADQSTVFERQIILFFLGFCADRMIEVCGVCCFKNILKN